jgi:chromosome segregation ATPase
VQGEPILSDAQRIEMLETALARYRAALEAQQQRIRELERELETLRARVQSAAKDP